MDRWRGRVALVTGASCGIGVSICRKLVTGGMQVVGAARRVEKVQELADELKGQTGKLIPMKCDLTQDDQVLKMFFRIKQKLGGVDVCINNAGAGFYHSLLEGNTEIWRRMLDLNVVALCLCTKESVASMRERGVDDGHVIHINSVCGHFVPERNYTGFYTATKYMVTALTEALQKELNIANSGIRVSSISPGLVETEFSVSAGKTKEAANALFSEYPPVLQPEDVADTLLHVLSMPQHVENLPQHITEIMMLPKKQKPA